jgi:flagellar basal-body rod modification protein FlgD
MAVTNVGNTISLADASKKAGATTGTKNVDTDTFLSLMLTEMQNQDPSSPMSSADMINQMATLNSVQAMQKMSTSLTSVQHLNEVSSATSMMGKTVTYADTDGTLISAKVDSIAISGADVTLTMGTQSIPLASVLKVT